MWVGITDEDLNVTKLAPLIDALRTKALGAGQPDPIPSIVADAVAQVRDYVAGCKTNVLDADTSKVPLGLKALTCRMIIREAMSRLQEPLNSDETQEKRDDLRRLEKIASCELPVDKPSNPLIPDEIQRGGGVEVVTKSTILTTHEQMRGL